MKSALLAMAKRMGKWGKGGTKTKTHTTLARIL